MIVNVGDVVRVDGHWKGNLNGLEGDVINVDYDKEVSLFDNGKKVFWVKNEFLIKVKEFYERVNVYNGS